MNLTNLLRIQIKRKVDEFNRHRFIGYRLAIKGVVNMDAASFCRFVNFCSEEGNFHYDLGRSVLFRRGIPYASNETPVTTSINEDNKNSTPVVRGRVRAVL